MPLPKRVGQTGIKKLLASQENLLSLVKGDVMALFMSPE